MWQFFLLAMLLPCSYTQCVQPAAVVHSPQHSAADTTATDDIFTPHGISELAWNVAGSHMPLGKTRCCN